MKGEKQHDPNIQAGFKQSILKNVFSWVMLFSFSSSLIFSILKWVYESSL